jgi:hypothetical protein
MLATQGVALGSHPAGCSFRLTSASINIPPLKGWTRPEFFHVFRMLRDSSGVFPDRLDLHSRLCRLMCGGAPPDRSTLPQFSAASPPDVWEGPGLSRSFIPTGAAQPRRDVHALR